MTDIDRRSFFTAVSAVAGAAAMAQVPAARAATTRPSGGNYPFRLGVASGEPTSTGVVLWTRLVPEPFHPGGGMEPDREWFYRFRYRGDISPVGRTRTAPPPGAGIGSLAFAFASCQRWQQGYFPSYRHMAGEDLDLVLHLGDYVYEYGIPADGGYRGTRTPGVLRQAPQDLERWRMQYALYKSDPDLQLAHARFPWLVTWDDHEVKNDYAKTEHEHAGDISALRASAYQAWYEHQPVRLPSRPDPDPDGVARIYRRLRWGQLAQLDLIDGRQYRSVPPCGWGEADAWDGFPAARKRLTDAWVNHGVSNPVVVTGDWHSTFVNDIHTDFDRDDSPVVGTEFVGTSISSNGDGEVYGPYYGPMIKRNPHIRFFDGDRRGYVRCKVDSRHFAADLRIVSTVSRSDAPEATYASFVVEDGTPVARRT